MSDILCLEVISPLNFTFMPSWRDKALLFSWSAETAVANVIFLRMLIIKWGKPWIKFITCFYELGGN